MPNPRNIFHRLKNLKYTACLVLLCLFPTYNYFVVKNVDAYPWWHSFGNDIDAAYAGTTVGLLNNSELTLVAHPAATLYTFHGVAYRLLSFFSPSHKRLLHLTEVRSLDDASEILQTATQTGRLISFFLSIIFIICIFCLIHLITQSSLLAFLSAFYIITSGAFLFHIGIIRPEIPNLLFFFAAVLLCLRQTRKKSFTFGEWAKIFIAVGFLLGFCVFSKIQIGFMLVVFMGIIIFYLFQRNKDTPLLETHPRNLWISLFVSLGSFILFPWWTLKKPEFVTPQFLVDPRIVDDVRRIYGAGKESFIGPVILILFCLMVISIILASLGKNRKKSTGMLKLFPVVSLFNFMSLGVIVSIYLVLLPISRSLARYIENTNHLIYATVSNVVYGGFLINKVFNAGTFEKIFTMHGNRSMFYSLSLQINVLCLVAVIAAICGVRFFLNKKGKRTPCLLVLCFFLTGLTMDILGTIRHRMLFEYYAIYSLSLYTIGLAFWASLELRDYSFKESINFVSIGKRPWIKKIFLLLPGVFIIFLTMHGVNVSRGYHFLKPVKTKSVSTQDPMTEYQNTRSHAAPFWKIVDRSINAK